MNPSLAPLLIAALVGADRAGQPVPTAALPLQAPVTAVAAPARGRAAEPPARGKFLIASRGLADPNFAETVILLLAYNTSGAVGVVINRPTGVRLAEVLPEVEALHDRPEHAFFGGPVLMNRLTLLVRAARQPKSAERIFDHVYATGSLDVLKRALGQRGKGAGVRAYLGHAGWGASQLDGEITRGDWYIAPAEAATVFDMDAGNIWPRLIERFSGQWTRRGPAPAATRCTAAVVGCRELQEGKAATRDALSHAPRGRRWQRPCTRLRV